VVLVDTSVWIEVFRKPPRIQLESLVDFDEIVTCLPVIHEVLQGFDAEPAFLRAREAMQAWPIVESPLSPDVWLQAHCQTPPSVPSDSDRTPRDPNGRDVGCRFNVEAASTPGLTVANERASELTRAEWGVRGPATRLRTVID
jgi:hypothetical protein